MDKNKLNELYNLLAYCRQTKQYEIGYRLCKLCYDPFDNKLLDELSIFAHYIGNYDEAVNILTHLLEQNISLEDKLRYEKNMKYSFDKITYKKYFTQFTEEEKVKLTKGLKQSSDYFLRELNLKIYPVFGTLLGIIRDNDYIGHDTDIDMAYLSNYHTEKEVVNEYDIICEKLEMDKLLLMKSQQISHLHVWNPSKTMRYDLWTSWTDKKGNYYLVWTVDGDLKSSMILPFQEKEFKGQTILMMNNPIEFLEAHYKDWKTPQKGNSLDWSKRPFPKWRLEKFR